MEMTDNEMNEHILKCKITRCKICVPFMNSVFPSLRAQEKYRQSEKYKNYRKEYYKKNKVKMNEQSRLYRTKNMD